MGGSSKLGLLPSFLFQTGSYYLLWLAWNSYGNQVDLKLRAIHLSLNAEMKSRCRAPAAAFTFETVLTCLLLTSLVRNYPQIGELLAPRTRSFFPPLASSGLKAHTPVAVIASSFVALLVETKGQFLISQPTDINFSQLSY